MGAIDLVIQIEAPPSVASGMQRIGRAGHQVGAPSHGILFPKYRADLIACAAVTRAMHEGHVESTRFLRNPLDVLAQQIVAIVAHPPLDVIASERRSRSNADDDPGPGISRSSLLMLARSAAPFAGLSAQVFDGVLDMLSGLYPSDEFAELRPRITWDRTRDWLTPRSGVKRIAILNGGTIPDRGLYGVFLAGERAKPVRVGELDEEMVFETKPGETFVLGASTWRVEEITHDRVLVSPAPGDPGKMPFWHGDQAGRPIEFGRRIGALVRELREMPRAVAITTLVKTHDLNAGAAENLMQYLADQELATIVVPDDRNIVIERVRDELGNWRICVLTPFGNRIHAPWAMAAAARIHANGGPDVETMSSEDGFVLRLPESDSPPDVSPLLLQPQEAADLVLQQLGSTALFAAKFRESASRALLLPRRRADGRTPLWQQRKRAYDLLAVASQYASFPILLEAYRECLRDVFDMPALMEVMRGIGNNSLRVHIVDSQTPSPFASALLFSYVANYIYDGDAPLAERRAQALSIDQDQLRELMGDSDLRELLDLAAIEDTEERLQFLAPESKARNMDGVHDLLLRLGDLSPNELRIRCISDAVAESVTKLVRARRVIEVIIAGERRFVAAEDAGRYRDALGTPLPPGLPPAFLQPLPDALPELLRRYARTHGPFTTADCASRFGLPLPGVASSAGVAGEQHGPHRRGRLPSRRHASGMVRRRSPARDSQKITSPPAQGSRARRAARPGAPAHPLAGRSPASPRPRRPVGCDRESAGRAATGVHSGDRDSACAHQQLSPGRSGYPDRGRRSHLGRLRSHRRTRRPHRPLPRGEVGGAVAGSDARRRFAATRNGEDCSARRSDCRVPEGTRRFLLPADSRCGRWRLSRRNTRGTVEPGMARGFDQRRTPRAAGLLHPALASQARQATGLRKTGFRSRRTTPPAAQGRWSLNAATFAQERSVTAWSHSIAQQLLTRYGVVFRETAHAENLPGGFSAIYDVLKAMEESGRVRRGYFAADLAATQFALPAAVDLLRSLRTEREDQRHEMLMLAATDPANPFGALLRWPEGGDAASSLARTVGARVVLCDGALVAYLRRDNPNLQVFLPDDEPVRGHVARALAEFLAARIRGEREDHPSARAGLLISTVNGVAVAQGPMARPLLDAGFVAGAKGFNVRRA